MNLSNLHFRIVVWLVAAALLVAPRATRAAGARPPSPPNSEAAQQAETKEFQLTAEQFQFSPNTIQVTQGDTVRIVVRSLDVTHGFSIDRFGIDEAIPATGEPVTVEFVASEAGRFQFVCSIYCGLGHDRVTGVLTVVPRTTAAVRAPAGPDELDDLLVDLAEPDFTVVTLPTTLRLANHKFAFRLTHRFSRPLNSGDFEDLLEDFFGFDSTALIGLELRFGLFPGTQIGINRGNTKTIQFFGRQNILWQGEDGGIGLDAFVSVEGTNNFRDEYSPAVGLILSKKVLEYAAFYAEPMWVGNTNFTGFRIHSFPDEVPEDDETFMIGLGARVRIRPTVYLVGEVVPRVAGYDVGSNHYTFGLEKRVGGHSFQVNFSNSLGTTIGQIVQGATEDDWFIGFNITRKFF